MTATWREVGDAVREVALGLIALGRQKGDAVAILSASRGEWVQADFAILSAGCVTVPIYPTYPPDLIAFVAECSAMLDDKGVLDSYVARRKHEVLGESRALFLKETSS